MVRATGMGGDFAQVPHAALSRVPAGDGRGVAVHRVDFGWLILRPWRFRSITPGLGTAVSSSPAASQVQRGQQRGGQARRRVDAAVRGSALDVGQSQQLGVHQVAGAKVLLVAVAGRVAGEGVAAGVA